MTQRIEFKHTSFLVLVKDEEDFSKKLINHINKQNIKAEFIIADGGKKKQKDIFEKIIQKKKYYYFGEDKNLLKFFNKNLKAVNKCSKKFIFYCDQDDLLNFEAIKRHEEFLFKNPDYSATKGIMYNFKYINNKISLLRKDYNDYHDFKFFFLRYFLNPNFRAYYCLHRKKNLKKSWVLAINHKVKDIRATSFLINIIALNAGRIKFYSEISVLRWDGTKKRDKKEGHFTNQAHKNRYEWFKYFFSEQKILIKRLLKNEKIFFKNFYFFKFYFFFFDILMNRIIRHNYISIFRKIFKKIFINTQNKNPTKIYKELNLKQIIDEDKILK